MDNMGGLSKLYLVYADNISSLVANQNGRFDLTLSEGAEMQEIYFIPDTGKLNETEEDTDNGIIYNFQATCKIAKCTPADTLIFDTMRKKKLIIVANDSNDNIWLAGFMGSYFDITVGKDTGADSQDLNHKILTISAKLPYPSVFITS
jgi:hypothetical protein